MKLFKLLLVLVLGSLVTGCYGRPSPTTCHAKFIRDEKGRAGDYDRCMAAYHCRTGDGPCPTKSGRGFWDVALPVVVAAAAVKSLREPTPVYVAPTYYVPPTYVAPQPVSPAPLDYYCTTIGGFTQCRVTGGGLDR